MEERPDIALTDKADQNLRSQVLYSRLFGAGGGENVATRESGATNSALNEESLFQVLGHRVGSKVAESAPQPLPRVKSASWVKPVRGA